MREKSATEPKPKKQRQSHAKVKSGCLTWIRRVKCDETKPSCLRCTSTWRKCDGYRGKEPFKFIHAIHSTQVDHVNHVLKGPTALTGSPRNPLLDFPGTQMEHRSLDFFRNGAAPALSGYFDANFWSEILPRVAHSEPAVQHALVALGSLYENCANAEDYPNAMQQRYALVYYNKAIRALKACRVEDPRTRDVTLLTCVLFVCLELLSGNPESALDHLDNGLNILRHSHQNKFGLSIPSHTQELDHQQSTERVLEETFSRLSLQASLCARRLPRIYPMNGRFTIVTAESARLPFKNIHEARSSLNEIFIQSFQPLDLPNESDIPDHLLRPARQSQRDSLISELHYWNSRLALYVTDSLPRLRQEEIHGSRVLRVLSIIAIIWNSTTESNMETAFDAYLQEYKTVVELISSLITDESSSGTSPSTSSSISFSPSTTETLSSATLTPPTPPNLMHDETIMPQGIKNPGPAFSFEMSLLPALYFTALKCRSPLLRRRAISLLRSAVPQREGLWDARILAAIAQRVIEIEESGMGEAQINQGYLETHWPREENRVHSVMLTPELGVAERRQGLLCMWKPDGVEGAWVQFVEVVEY